MLKTTSALGQNQHTLIKNHSCYKLRVRKNKLSVTHRIQPHSRTAFTEG